ncbi:MAG TPA: hypothetical protein VGF17_04720 [Phytomonospora sp.]
MSETPPGSTLPDDGSAPASSADPGIPATPVPDADPPVPPTAETPVYAPEPFPPNGYGEPPASPGFPPPFPPTSPPPKRGRAGLWFLAIVGLVVLVAAGVAIPLALRGKPTDTATITPAESTAPPWSLPLVAEEIFPEELGLVDHYSGDVRTFEREREWDHDGNCPGSGANKKTEKFLDGCEARAEGIYESDDGDYQVAYQIFAFPRDENLTYGWLDKAPEDFEVNWKPQAEMRNGYWWRLDIVGPFLVLTHAGATGVWDDEVEKTAEDLVGTASDRLIEAVKDVMYW